MVLLSFILMIFSCVTYAHEEVFNPIQKDLFQSFFSEDSASTELVLPSWNEDFKAKFNTIRVKVFPHNSQYNAPHGRDTVTDRFTVATSGVCRVYKSDSESSNSEFKRDNQVATFTNFEFTVAKLNFPVWIECNQPFEIIRSDFPTKKVNYSGVLFIKKVNHETPYLTAVNVLPFEQYLKGVVPSEMPASWAVEALKAQAIAARTYAYYELGTHVADSDKNIQIEQSGAQIDDTVTYQAYLGLKNAAASTNKAVDETSGMVMLYDKKIIKSFFHADSGGYTENAENVWGVFHPYIIAKPEIYSADSIPGTSWSFVANIKDIETKLIGAAILKEGEELVNLTVEAGDVFPSGRPQFITLTLKNEITKKITAVNYSFIMGLKSQWLRFSAGATPDKVQVNGLGFGHGAGMNQWGARHMIEKMNKKFDEVLNFYYSNIEISN